MTRVVLGWTASSEPEIAHTSSDFLESARFGVPVDSMNPCHYQ